MTIFYVLAEKNILSFVYNTANEEKKKENTAKNDTI